jgi:hypothetical protein
VFRPKGTSETFLCWGRLLSHTFVVFIFYFIFYILFYYFLFMSLVFFQINSALLISTKVKLPLILTALQKEMPWKSETEAVDGRPKRERPGKTVESEKSGNSGIWGIRGHGYRQTLERVIHNIYNIYNHQPSRPVLSSSMTCFCPTVSLTTMFAFFHARLFRALLFGTPHSPPVSSTSTPAPRGQIQGA